MNARLEVARDVGRSVVVSAEASSPLKLLTPRNHGHAAWVYQSSQGGGFVGADDVRLAVEVAAGASLFLSSQASSKVYRASAAQYALTAAVADGATLVSWPDPVVCFAGASLAQTQTFSLRGDARLVCVDAWTSGRLAHGERWAFERLLSRIRVEVDGVRVFQDGVLLSAQHGALDVRMGPINAFATVVVAGALAALSSELVARVRAQPLGDPATTALCTASVWPWGVVLRLGAPTAEALVVVLGELLGAPVAALLGDDPWARKW